jgi:hypothetical protein
MTLTGRIDKIQVAHQQKSAEVETLKTLLQKSKEFNQTQVNTLSEAVEDLTAKN